MKKELLRINRLNYNYTRTRKLENVSFCILEGECIGFLGLSYSGKDLMTSLLRGELTEGDGSGAIYLGGQKVNDWEVLGKEIYYMCPDNYVIEDWTVAEYLCLVDSGWAGSFWRKGVLNEEAGECFAELELDFDISSRMRDLSELEKRIVDVVKAYRKGARIIIIEDEFDGVSQTDIIKFGKIIRRLIQRKLGVIVNSNSNFIMSELSDKFIIFDRGHVVKKCAREYIKNEAQLERFLLGENVLPPREKIEERTQMSWKEEDIVYRIRNLKIFQDDVKSLNFVRGEVVTLLTLNRRKKELLFLILSGRINVENVHYILNGERYDNIDCSELTRKKVVSVRALGSREEVFEHMTVGENLMLPSLEKISFWDYIRSSRNIRKIILEENHNLKDVKAEGLGINERIQMTLERWYIFNPTAILLDPVDYDGSADIIKEIQDRDIPVILFDAPTPEGSGLTSVGNDFAEQATIAVDMLVEKMGTKGKVAVMQGAPTAPNHAERYQAHLDALAKYPDIQVIDGGIDNDNVETAQSQAAAVLAANPDLTGYLNCDACGSGVAAAIEEKGMQDKVTFVAMDNLIEILDYVKTGTITATSSTLPQEQGMYAVLMAYQAAQGMPLPANVDTGIGRITADNIDEWIETVSAK